MIRSKSYRYATLTAVGSSLIFAGCSTETTESTNINTPGIYASINVDAGFPSSTRVNVELNVGGLNGTNIELSGTERLDASVGGQTKTLVRDSDLFDVDYEVNFNTSSSADPFRILFYRADGSIVDGSVVSLPDEFTVTSPANNQTFTFDSNMSLGWTPGRSGQTIDVFFSTACTTNTGSTLGSSSRITITDDGQEEYSLNLLPSATNPDLDKTRACSLDVTYKRSQTGSLDSAFQAGGQILSSQSREVENMTVTFNQ